MTVLLTWKVLPAEREFIASVWPRDLERVEMVGADPAELAKVLPEISAVVGFNSTFPHAIVAEMTSLKVVQILGHGVDGVLGSAHILRERGVIVARANPADIPIAEFVIGNLIVLNRRILAMHNRLAHFGDWSEAAKARRGEGSLGGELYGSTLGLIGYGGIAREIHTRAQAFGMRVILLARDPRKRRNDGLDEVLPWERIDEFLGRCHHVVLALPLTAETRRMIDADRLAAMRPGSFLVNISRGGLIDEDALQDALVRGHLAGAALDVFEAEDEGRSFGYPLRHPVHDLNVVLTPHYASGTQESRYRSLRVVGENLARMLAGRPLENVADFDRGY